MRYERGQWEYVPNTSANLSQIIEGLSPKLTVRKLKKQPFFSIFQEKNTGCGCALHLYNFLSQVEPFPEN